jgi:hypothetical protein
MAKQTAVSGDDALFQGEDHTFVFTILTEAETAAIDITGWTLSWMVKRNKSDADLSALLSKTTAAGIVISGVFNSAPATNTQIATVTVDDTDTTAIPEGLYHHELKRMDAGFETVLGYGIFELVQGVIR